MSAWLYPAIFAVVVLACLVWLVREFGAERIWVTLLSMLAGVGVIHLLTIVNILPTIVRD